jgi:hypothetical protein
MLVSFIHSLLTSPTNDDDDDSDDEEVDGILKY